MVFEYVDKIMDRSAFHEFGIYLREMLDMFLDIAKTVVLAFFPYYLSEIFA